MTGRESEKRRRKRRRKREGIGAASVATESAASARRSKDDLARERLVPLREGERPPAVTVAAIVAALIAISNLIGYAAGIKVEGSRPPASGVALQAAVMLVAAIGMWYARYWAVLGFQAILVFLILIMSVLLLRAQNVLGAMIALAIIAAAGTLFWFLVKSLARIQMPERRPPAS